MRPQRRGVAMTVIGALMLVLLAPAAAAIGIFIGVKGGLDNIVNAPVVSAGQSRHVAAGQAVTLFAYVGPTSKGNGVSDSISGPFPPNSRCRVTDSSGSAVDVTGASNMRITRNGGEYHAAGAFTAPKDDAYTISCGDHRAIMLDSSVASHLLRDMMLPIGFGVGGAVIIGLIGLTVLIVGIVRINRSNRQIREFDMWGVPGPVGGGPGYGQPYYPQQGRPPYPTPGPLYPPQEPYGPDGPKV